MFTSSDFKNYRLKLGYGNKNTFKIFLAAKDIIPDIDYNYIDLLNNRLKEIFTLLNEIYYKPYTFLDDFFNIYLLNTYKILKNNNILNKLNNQGRRKEDVYFSWMRGYLICEYFKGAISDIFNVPIEKIKQVGDDDFDNIETFKRTPKADLEIDIYRIEVQSGFQGINDIKEHKVREAKRVFDEKGLRTIISHFDLFNGQVAFVDISNIEEDNLNWITRQQMEGQSVFNIEQNYFQWLLTETPPAIIFDDL